jgi:hypothetical protein
MNSTKKTARVAGALYLLSAVPGFFSTMYIPRTLIVTGNATATANNILASEMLFRAGIVSELISAVVFIFQIWALYRLLSRVNKTHASLMVILALIIVPIAFLIVLNEIAALTLFRGADFLSAFDKSQLGALAMLFLVLHRYGFVVNEIFWGLWLVPFGLLVMRSGFLPQILGISLIIACFGYLTLSLTSLLFPPYVPIVSRYAMVLILGELPIILWLLIMGAKDQPLSAPA